MDIVKVRVQPALPKGEKRASGGQPGHKGKTLRQVEKPDQVCVHLPERCAICGREIAAGEPHEVVSRRQVFDLSEPKNETGLWWYHISSGKYIFKRFDMNVQRTIAKRYTKMKLKDQKTDFEFWQSQTSGQRLAALEQIRSEFHRWKYDSEPRFQRVLTIIKRT